MHSFSLALIAAAEAQTVDFTSDSVDFPQGIADLKTYAASQPNGKLRFVMPNADYAPPHFVRGPPHVKENQGVGGSNLMGALPNFVAGILRAHDIGWEMVQLSDESLEWSPSSSYTASVYDVAVGNADMGLANYLITSQRIKLASFTTTLYSDHYYLVVRREKQTVSFFEAMVRPFAPYSGGLWLVIILIFAYVRACGASERVPPRLSLHASSGPSPHTYSVHLP